MTKQIVFAFTIIVLMLFASYGCSTADKQTSDKIESANEPESLEEVEIKKILFFGNSITAGFGLDVNKAFPALIQQRLDSMNLNYEVVNAGNSGETSSGGLGRIEWVLYKPVDIFVLELGANDGLRGISTEETYKNLSLIIDEVRGKYPNCKIVIAGMQVPPNMGLEYAENFKTIFPKLAEDKNCLLIPFILEGVAGNPKLNLEDRIHPTEEGHRILRETVWQVIAPLIISA